MKFQRIGLGFAFAMIASFACSQELVPQSPLPMQSVATNNFSIDLQEGFYQNHEAIIKVDGQEVYRGIPKTSSVLGLATHISVRVTSQQPVVVFTMPSAQISWTNQINLRAGATLGISINTKGAVKVQQSDRFAYD